MPRNKGGPRQQGNAGKRPPSSAKKAIDSSAFPQIPLRRRRVLRRTAEGDLGVLQKRRLPGVHQAPLKSLAWAPMDEYHTQGLNVVYDQDDEKHRLWEASLYVKIEAARTLFQVSSSRAAKREMLQDTKDVAIFAIPHPDYVIGVRMLRESFSVELWLTAKEGSNKESRVWRMQLSGKDDERMHASMGMWCRLRTLFKSMPVSDLDYVNVARPNVAPPGPEARYNPCSRVNVQETAAGRVVKFRVPGVEEEWEFTGALADPEMIQMFQDFSLEEAGLGSPEDEVPAAGRRATRRRRANR
ncbi:MAG: hypothetical protein M1819_003421 [Sarea resinae]|nr:MAG: hypothetical protein M1819_003421 [Sarea resinae]